MYFSYGTIW